MVLGDLIFRSFWGSGLANGLGLRVWGVGFRVQGLGSKIMVLDPLNNSGT